MGFLRNILNLAVDKSFISDAEKVVNVCRSFGPQERSEMKVCALLALAALVAEEKQNPDGVVFKVLEAMSECKQLSSQEAAIFSAYTMKLISMQKQANASGSPIVNLIGGGIPVWIVSIRALSNVAVLPYARELWAILQNSEPVAVYDRIDEVAKSMAGHPIVDPLLSLRVGFETPNLFVPR